MIALCVTHVDTTAESSSEVRNRVRSRKSMRERPGIPEADHEAD